jgi:ubiquinone/menaquinone biosynthesis C-methylase UbiE
VVAIHAHAEAWTEFWRDQDQQSPCCAGSPAIRSRLDGHWHEYARILPSGARVLDLGCGTAAVGRALLASRPSLQVVGVDFSMVPNCSDGRIRILPNTAMESVPFADAMFDSAVSQFGFEYANVQLASRELARVLRPSASFSFLVHHSDSRIAIDSTGHRMALEAICGPEIETAFLSGEIHLLERALSTIRREGSTERIIEEASEGLRRHIGRALIHRSEIWRAVKAALEPELVMLAGLQGSTVPPATMQSWLRPLAANFELRVPTVMEMAAGQPLCWVIEGQRRAPTP